MQNENPISKLKIIHTKKTKNVDNNFKNTHIENAIINASKLSNKSEVKVYFKNIPAKEYSLGYQNFCGIKINNFVFYNPSLFDLYPNIIDYLFIEYRCEFEKCILNESINNIFISDNENIFEKSKPIIKSNLYLNLNLSFDEMITSLDRITEFMFKTPLKVLTLCSIKN